ncbi:MAG TPA: hypothetical protein PLE45_02160 [Spirochaetota bacterium]|nr:hypothetical protein [Spirochaetota bacterium]HOL57492.1 hypothetical protein [Spirochaetota bacterium]HPP04423.1 hypothetical protein [Spirochaetota bacterium]
MNIEEIFVLKTKNIHKKIYANVDYSEIENDVDHLLSFIEKNYKDIEFLKKIEEVVNLLSIRVVIENKEYIDSFYKKILNYYSNLLKIDKNSFFALIFTIIIQNYGYAGIFEITRLILKFLLNEYDIDIPIEEKESIYDIFSEIIQNLIKMSTKSSSYTLFKDSLIRNKIILYLYEYYKKNKRLNIFFRFAGIGIEPLMFSYTIRILYEIENGKEIKNLNMYCYDEEKKITYFLNSNLFEKIFLKLKESICLENDFKIKKLKTNLKIAKNDLIIINELKVLENIDFIILNNLSIVENSENLLKEFSFFKEGKIIIEKTEDTEIDKKILYETGCKLLHELASNFDSQRNKVVKFLLLEKNSKKEIKNIKNNYEDIDKLFFEYNRLNHSELKRKIDLIKIRENSDYLKYAFLLCETGHHSKAFEIIKKYYELDYSLSYKIFRKIIQDTKNKKLKNSVEQFIKENKIIEKGFAADLIEAINDEIDEYFENNKFTHKLKSEDWV